LLNLFVFKGAIINNRPSFFFFLVLTDASEHYYEIETSTSTIQDLIGTAHLVGYNFSSGDLVDDAP